MSKITTCLWFNGQALDTANYYISIFPDSKITNIGRYDKPNPHVPGSQSGDVMITEFDLMGTKFASLNGGPYFKIDPSISFFVIFTDKNELQKIWNRLIDGGKVLMPLDVYPWGEKYGWIQDKYGVSWQLHYDSGATGQRIIPFLAFTKERAGKAEEAIGYYTSVFPNSGVDMTTYYEAGEGDIPGYMKHARFHLNKNAFMAMDTTGPHTFSFSCAVSFMIPCSDQKELDYYYDTLSAVPEAEQCGWICDKYGVSWQLIPVCLTELMNSGNKKKSAKLMEAILNMKRLSIAEIEKAYYY